MFFIRERSQMVAFLFPSKAEAVIFLRRLSRIQKPEISEMGGLVFYEFFFKRQRVLVIITGMGKNILRLAETQAFNFKENDLVVLTGLAKSFNKKFKIGAIVGVEMVKKENEAGVFPVPNKPFPGIPYATLITCDRLVFRCTEEADLADMEGYYAVQKFKNISIVKAVSDQEEDIEFLNEFFSDGRIQIGSLLHHITAKQYVLFFTFLRNAHSARKKLAFFLMDFLTNVLSVKSTD